MPDWTQLFRLMDFCTVYYTTQLVRCAAFSFVLIGIVMLLRKTLFSERTFFKGMLWAMFLVIPFLGRLKLFYENEVVLKATWRITEVTSSWLWVDRIYMLGILGAAICIFGRRLRIRRTVARMEKGMFDSTRIYVTDINVTPFTIGLLKPKIVLPKVIVDSYGRDELKTIIRHEQTHIRLGHLWCGFAWDILRCLLWINPFLTICLKAFQTDMEDICDRVCIQNGGREAHEYGLVLLRSLKLLCPGQGDVPPAATYVGEKDFVDMKRRMEKIVSFRPYRKRLCMGMVAILAIIIGAILLTIHSYSYAQYTEDENILAYEYDARGGVAITDYDNSLDKMISYDDSYVYVDREAFEAFLRKNNVEGQTYIVFGGFYKLPGFSCGGQSCLYETDSADEVVRIPYLRQSDDWVMALFKIL